MGGDYRHPFCEGKTEALRVTQFITRAGKGVLFTGVSKERESELRQAFVKLNEPIFGRVDLLYGGEPLYKNRPFCGRLV
jgi:hypothetical protein